MNQPSLELVVKYLKSFSTLGGTRVTTNLPPRSIPSPLAAAVVISTAAVVVGGIGVVVVGGIVVVVRGGRVP